MQLYKLVIAFAAFRFYSIWRHRVLRFLKVIFWVCDRALEVWTPPVLVGMENIEVSWLIFL